jgi:hypothetical protein
MRDIPRVTTHAAQALAVYRDGLFADMHSTPCSKDLCDVEMFS